MLRPFAVAVTLCGILPSFAAEGGAGHDAPGRPPDIVTINRAHGGFRVLCKIDR